MDVEKVLCMVHGSGETSYAANSKLQVGFLLANAPFPTKVIFICKFKIVIYI